MQQKREKDNEQLRMWMKQSGCIVHPAIQIPGYYNGVQGIGTRQYLPHKTVIIAVPSKLVITVPRCYTDPHLKSLFKSSDQLFDYEADEDAQFNVLCVFLMYQKLHIEKSPWSQYLKTVAEPETGVSWPYKDLAGLNKSVIEQILHVRQQCKKVEQRLCTFLSKTKQFKHLSNQQIVGLFRICYPTVLTRCFGYYFSTACMIPIADLMNHGCETVDHQLIHLNFQMDKQFDETYHSHRQKLDCEILGLPKGNKQKMPFRLEYLLNHNLIENNVEALSTIRRSQIDQRIQDYLSKKLLKDDCLLQELDFCEEDDEQDNDTDQEQQYGQTKGLQYIKAAQKQQMVQFQKYYLKVMKLGDVEKEIQQKQPDSDEQKETNISNNNQQRQQIKDKQETEKKTNEKERNLQKNQNQKITNAPNATDKASCPVECIGSSSEQSGSEQQEWCLDETCYFTMSTHTPANPGQLFNSYGSRTNKFLLVWYGFTYPNNLYDSVTLRLQVNFPDTRPKAKDIVLDTYIGGQGLCFKKNQQQQVKAEEVSRQFRLKRSRLPMQLIIFLRLVMVKYYEGVDNYKILCTFPSSFQFEIQLLQYFKELVQCLYQRYPLEVIQSLKQELGKQEDMGRKSRLNFKIIYLEEQRKILASNIEAVEGAIIAMKRLQKQKEFSIKIYQDLNIKTIKKIKQYLIEIKNNLSYILYSQPDPTHMHQLEVKQN